MGLELQRPELTELKPRIIVIGVGGAGGNAVNNMIRAGLTGTDFAVANTDAQSLTTTQAETRIQLGLKITQGLGAGGRAEIGRAAAEETLDQIDDLLEGSHMCFIAAGMGGGTGTGAAPVIAEAARKKGILTVGVVTKPFSFEGTRRMRAAEEGISELQKHVDTLIIIPNQNLFLIANAATTFKEAFSLADQVLHQGVRGVTDLMTVPGLMNLDFADVRTVMTEMGKAMMGTGEATGENRAVEAAQKAISNPLLDEVSMRGARGIIINITGGEDLGLMELDEAANHIRDLVHPDANIMVGSAFSEDLEGIMRVSVIATGIEADENERAAAPAMSRNAAPASSAPGTPDPSPRTKQGEQAQSATSQTDHNDKPEAKPEQRSLGTSEQMVRISTGSRDMFLTPAVYTRAPSPSPSTPPMAASAPETSAMATKTPEAPAMATNTAAPEAKRTAFQFGGKNAPLREGKTVFGMQDAPQDKEQSTDPLNADADSKAQDKATADEDARAQADAAPQTGSPADNQDDEARPMTLFERMMMLNRSGDAAAPAEKGAADAQATPTREVKPIMPHAQNTPEKQEEDPHEDIRIPSFFKRQVND